MAILDRVNDVIEAENGRLHSILCLQLYLITPFWSLYYIDSETLKTLNYKSLLILIIFKKHSSFKSLK